MTRISAKPIVVGVVIGALAGAVIGLIMARRPKNGQGQLDPKHVTNLFVAALSLARQVIDALA